VKLHYDQVALNAGKKQAARKTAVEQLSLISNKKILPTVHA